MTEPTRGQVPTADVAKRLLVFLIGVAMVVGLSCLSASLWGPNPEARPVDHELAFRHDMTLDEFAKANALSPAVLKHVFAVTSHEDLARPVSAFEMTREQVLGRARKALVIEAEHGGKNWQKILLKFALWLTFLAVVFGLLRRRRVTARSRQWLYVAAVCIFGVILGSDPNPMGTVNDAVVLLGAEGIIFPPRLIAFGVFTLLVVVANKFICGWGCQLGTLQDAVFRLNRDGRDRRGLVGQFKIPFVVTNTVRVLVFATMVAAAMLWAMDVVGYVDPFRIFKPQTLGVVGGVFAGGILVLSLFTYRPWCHLFCPFGLVGWLAEKISVTKVRVDYDKCIACGACARACPSTVMEATLKRNRVIPDCFACGNCIETCPVKAICWSAGSRPKPPAGKFAKMEDRDHATAPADNSAEEARKPGDIAES